MKSTDTPLEPGRHAARPQARRAEERALSGSKAASEEDALLARFRNTRRAASRPSLWWMRPSALAATITLVAWMIRGPLPAALVATTAAEVDPGRSSR